MVACKRESDDDPRGPGCRCVGVVEALRVPAFGRVFEECLAATGSARAAVGAVMVAVYTDLYAMPRPEAVAKASEVAAIIAALPGDPAAVGRGYAAGMSAGCLAAFMLLEQTGGLVGGVTVTGRGG